MSARRTSSLLIDEQPLQVIPSLAEALGVNAAILLQQINYWIKHAERKGEAEKFKAGKWWTYNTYSDWQEQMPWLTESGIRKLVQKLKDEGLIATVKYSKQGRDHTLWYTINYEAVEDLRTKGQTDVTDRDTSNDHSGADDDVPHRDDSYATENPESLSENPTGGGSFACPQIEGLAHHHMKRIYNAMKQAGFTITGKNKDTKENEYGRLVGRVQWMLDNMDPSDPELDELPEAYVRAYKIRGAATDAVYALNELRRQKARPEVLAEGNNQAPSVYDKQVAAAREDKPRGPAWYVAFYDNADELSVARWIAEGATHTDITTRLEGAA